MSRRTAASIAGGIALSGLMLSTAWATTVLDANFGSFNFGADDGSEQTFKIGENAAEGFTYRYDNVITIGGVSVDAVATIIDITNLDNDDDESNGANNLLDDFDDDSSSGEEIDLDIDVFGDSGDPEAEPPVLPEASTGSVTFRIDFVEDGSTDPVILENIAVLVKDIDSKQFVKFAGITAYELSADPATELSVASSGGLYTFSEPLGASSSSSHEENWVAVEWADISSVTIVAGADVAGGASFGISFMDTVWESDTDPATPPTRQGISLTAYDVTYDSNSADSGSVPTTQSSDTDSSVVTLVAPQGNLVRSGFTFGGWNTRSDGTGANYETGDSIALGSDITLFARWIPSTVASSSASNPDPQPVDTPAIHLEIQSPAGLSSASTPVLHEGEGLARNTPYTLRLGPSGQVIASGVVDRFGYFSETVMLPGGLAPGAYFVTLSTTDPAGNPLSLTQTFTVGAAGIVTGVGSTVPVMSGQALAATGVSPDITTWALPSLVGLTLLGTALWWADYARRHQLSVPGEAE